MSHELVNGVDVDELRITAASLQQDPALARFKFRVENTWVVGGHNQSVVKQFYGIGQEQPHAHRFVLDADEPPLLQGSDEGPNPVEYLLNALVSCLTSSMVYHAAIRGIRITDIDSSVEGNIDIRGFMGLSPEVRKGYEDISVIFNVASDGTAEELEECARMSPVLDTVSRSTPVHLRILTA